MTARAMVRVVALHRIAHSAIAMRSSRHVIYPVFPSNSDAPAIAEWLRGRPQ
ncbi:MAG: hypothetical protein ABIZ36_11560 [Gemmatimonadaceae bacterium]